MTTLEIEQIPVLRDNYVYLVRDPATGACAAIDPSVAGPVKAVLDRKGWRLTHIFNTHHHHDHVGGNLELKAMTGCRIIGNAADASRIPGIDEGVAAGDVVTLGTAQGSVFDISGHTIGHIAFWFAAADALFCGDTLFSLGCGRLFEGSPAQMWRSLQTIRGLPDATRVFCAHEYTASNAAFALSIDPDNATLQRRSETIHRLRQQGQPTVPSLLGEERYANPFLRADDPVLQVAIGLAGADAVTAFTEIRRRKDVF